LCCQIDAAINPGSSGGPVIKDDKIVRVAFEAMAGENIGYMVSVPVAIATCFMSTPVDIPKRVLIIRETVS
jgi:S1-C subfamily serine protease